MQKTKQELKADIESLRQEYEEVAKASMSDKADKAQTTCNLKPRKRAPYNYKVKTGRPKVWTEEKLLKLVQQFIDWLMEDDANLFQIQFCKQIGVWHDIFFQADDEIKNEKFCRLFAKARKIQSSKITQGCLYKELDGRFGAFLLSSKFDHKVTSEQEITTKNNAPIQVIFSEVVKKV